MVSYTLTEAPANIRTEERCEDWCYLLVKVLSKVRMCCHIQRVIFETHLSLVSQCEDVASIV